MLLSDTVRAASLAWLATPPGEALLAEASALPDDRLTRLERLRRRCSAELAAVTVELLELRIRARSKFSAADRMLLTREGLEQATGDRIAEYRASRYKGCGTILDACCGIGGDARRLAAVAPVFAVDRNPAAVLCALHNARLEASRREPGGDGSLNEDTGSDSMEPGPFPVWSLCADILSLPLGRLRARGFDAVFFDPSRRSDGPNGERRRARTEDYSPPLSWLDVLKSHFDSVGAKVSPAIEDDALRLKDARVEFLSDRGECKEALLWFGAAAEPLSLPAKAAEPYFATVLRPGRPAETLAPSACTPLVCRPPSEYLYEPDPAVIRAHQVPQIAATLNAAAIEPGIAYLTSDRYLLTPFATGYRIVDTLPFDRKAVQRRLRALGAHVSAVKKRGVPFDPAVVQKSLTPGGNRPLILVLTKLGRKTLALLCENA